MVKRIIYILVTICFGISAILAETPTARCRDAKFESINNIKGYEIFIDTTFLEKKILTSINGFGKRVPVEECNFYRFKETIHSDKEYQSKPMLFVFREPQDAMFREEVYRGDSIWYSERVEYDATSRTYVKEGLFFRIDQYPGYFKAMYFYVTPKLKAKADSVLDNLIIIPIEKGASSPQ